MSLFTKLARKIDIGILRRGYFMKGVHVLDLCVFIAAPSYGRKVRNLKFCAVTCPDIIIYRPTAQTIVFKRMRYQYLTKLP